jgi:lipopolysaccharide transport system ATP-binding protein
MITPALSVRSLSKRFELYDRPIDRLKQTLWRGRRQFYREFWALRDVGFTLAPGQALGVVGRNGSGKSTLLQLVAGTLTPTTGEVDAIGRVSALLELGSGFNPEFSGRENVFLNGAILGLPHAEMRALIPELLAFADIGDFVDRPVKTYSSGMALRLAFAVATAVAPRILIVDEALAVGDEAFQRKCFARIEKIRESGAAILFVSHSPLQILELCDVALLLDAGEMLLLDEPKRVVPEYQRILYALPEAATALRQRLRSNGASREAHAAEGADTKPIASADGAVHPAAATSLPAPGHTINARRADAPRPVASFDPGLRSASVVEYAQHGARIRAPRIVTAEGDVVNVLVRDDLYNIVYDVTFLHPARCVRCGMMIKSTSGLELGGAIYPSATPSDVQVAQGTAMHLRFEFRCRLFAGMYFLNVGVWGEVEGTDTFLHRLVDAIAFRVEPEASRAPSGYVDFGIQAAATLTGDRVDGQH